MELTVLVVATVLTSRAVVVATLHPSCAAVVAQPQAVAELQAVAAAVEVAVRAEKCLMYLEPTRLDQWLDQCCAAMQPSLDSSR
jgi:hypothetical protein